MRGIAGSEGGVRGGFTIREKHIKITPFECPWLIDGDPYTVLKSSEVTGHLVRNNYSYSSINAVARKPFWGGSITNINGAGNEHIYLFTCNV